MQSEPPEDHLHEIGPSRPPAPALAYAPGSLFKDRADRVDGLELALSLLQLGLALLLIAQRFPSRGYHELRDPTWWKWLAWHASGGAWMIWAWAVASLLALIGTAQPPGRRRRWYTAYVAIWVAGTIACVVGMMVLDRINAQDRWVPNIPGAAAGAWESVVIEPVVCGQVLLFLTITNPLLILFAVRRRFEPPVRTSSG